MGVGRRKTVVGGRWGKRLWWEGGRGSGYGGREVGKTVVVGGRQGKWVWWEGGGENGCGEREAGEVSMVGGRWGKRLWWEGGRGSGGRQDLGVVGGAGEVRVMRGREAGKSGGCGRLYCIYGSLNYSAWFFVKILRT